MLKNSFGIVEPHWVVCYQQNMLFVWRYMLLYDAVVEPECQASETWKMWADSQVILPQTTHTFEPGCISSISFFLAQMQAEACDFSCHSLVVRGPLDNSGHIDNLTLVILGRGEKSLITAFIVGASVPWSWLLLMGLWLMKAISGMCHYCLVTDKYIFLDS